MKKLIAIAIVAGLSVPAMAETRVYGQLHASVDGFDSEDISLSSNTSRIGVKGSSQLNNGLKAIYKAEWEINTGSGGRDPDGSSLSATKSVFSNRNQVVGLAGRRGAVLVGRHDTPMKIIGRKADLFWSSQLGQNRSGDMLGEWDARPDNVIAYQSPKVGGFQVLAARITQDSADNRGDNDGWSLNGVYKAGPLMLGAA
ncbi:MAG TPA: porin, partial [Thiotrichaceae bacterium]|nr:porin [Thiotrichaceae bacterium]